MSIESTLNNILNVILNNENQSFDLTAPLLGEYPELDSMGIMTLLLELEVSFTIEMNDIDLNADTFATFGSLVRCIESASSQKQLVV
jgi:acyl carrier protein